MSDETAEDPDSPRRILFSLDGRIGRRAWWLWGVLAMLGLSIYFTTLLRVAGAPVTIAEGVVNLLLVWPVVAIHAKRWHDRGKAAWWVLILLIPVLGWIWAMVECGFLRGQAGSNRFGPG
jgi:uncharacterized membrane protein YhaH (DUF805 family)